MSRCYPSGPVLLDEWAQPGQGQPPAHCSAASSCKTGAMAEDPLTFEVTEDLVRALLADQHPDLASRPIQRVARGWDNATFRVGKDLTVRMPQRIGAAFLIGHERQWVPTLLEGVPNFAAGGLDASDFMRNGRPGAGYPWAWAIGRWHEGVTVADAKDFDRSDAANRLGRFLAAVHRPAPSGAPDNPWRGGPLSERSPILTEHLDRLAELDRGLGEGITRNRVEDRWAELVDAPVADPADLGWIHGDLHLANLLVRGGHLSAVIDFGDITSGDRATDLAVAWPLFEGATRERFRTAAGRRRPIDDATWTRSAGWALALSIAYLQGEYTTPTMERVARRGLTAVLSDGHN